MANYEKYHKQIQKLNDHTKFKLSDGSFTMDGTIVSNKFNEFILYQYWAKLS